MLWDVCTAAESRVADGGVSQKDVFHCSKNGAVHFWAKVIHNSPVRSLFKMQRDSVELSPFSRLLHRSAMR